MTGLNFRCGWIICLRIIKARAVRLMLLGPAIADRLAYTASRAIVL